MILRQRGLLTAEEESSPLLKIYNLAYETNIALHWHGVIPTRFLIGQDLPT